MSARGPRRPPSPAHDRPPSAARQRVSPGAARGPRAAERAGGLSAGRGLSLALLAAATLAAFAGVLRNGWILLDDPEYVVGNPHVTRGLTLDGLLWFLHVPHGGNWHPLTSASHLLDVTLFGLRPAGHHAVSLALHAANAVLLALTLRRLTGAWWRSVLVAALFALHPLRVESVAWVAERKDVLSGLLFVLTLWAYARWAERPGAARHALVVVGLALGLMAKPMLVTVPFVLVLLDVWPLGRLAGMEGAPGAGATVRAPARTLGGLLAEKWPLFLLAAVSAAVTLLVQGGSGAVVSTRLVTPGFRAANALLSYWRYVGKSFWPTGLAIFYPYDRVLDVPRVALAGLALAALTALAFRQARRRPHLLVGWLWYVGMLVPVIGLVQVGGQACADRYTYLPTIGLGIALVWLVGDLVAPSRPARIAAALVAALALTALGVATARQVALWTDSRTLLAHALAVTRDNAIAEQGMGNALLEANDVVLAIAHLDRAYQLEPGLPDLENNLGSALGLAGRFGEAAVHFRAALRTQPTADLHHNLAAALLGEGRVAEAIPEYESALRLDPTSYASLVQLAAACAAVGRFSDAVRAGERAYQVAKDAGQAQEVERCAQRLALYRAGKTTPAR
jgi:Flp pilus assembly protein TadD